MKKTRITIRIISILAVISLISCSPIWLKFSGILEDKPNLKYLSNGDKNVTYVPIHHIGRKIYYDRLTETMDSLSKSGYVIYYETVKTNLKDTNEIAKYYRKFRKIQGNLDAGGNYLDTVNNKIAGRINYPEKYNLINQPSYTELISDSLNAVNVDLKIEELIDAFEKNEGTIKLNDCDRNIKFDDKYKCEQIDKKKKKLFREKYVLNLRNKNLANTIKQSKYKRFFIIYGKSHFKGLVKELKEIDSNWKKK